MLTLPQATALGPLEHALMRIVWAHAAPITVKHVHKTLRADRDLAYTTVMTTMVRLAEKGVITRTPNKPGIRGLDCSRVLRVDDAVLCRPDCHQCDSPKQTPIHRYRAFSSSRDNRPHPAGIN